MRLRYAALLFLPAAFAFPHFRGARDTAAVRDVLATLSQHPELMAQITSLQQKQQAELNAWKAQSKPDPSFNSTANQPQRRDEPNSVEGLKRFPEDEFPFIPPSKTDQRGPCPGMNALANHGYLPRNGIVNVLQVFEAVDRVFNMAVDLAAFLTIPALVSNGDIQTLTFSIGGADPRTNSLGDLGGILGTETGLDGHGRSSEGDVSATRCDFYLCAGDNHNMQPELFSQLLRVAESHSSPGETLFSVPVMQEHFHNRYAHSRSHNPNFYFMPPSGLVVMGANYFYPGFYTNGTFAPASGGLTGANLASVASFVGAKIGDDGGITYVPERIPPQGWYRRGFPLNLVETLTGILSIYLVPEPVEFGGNAGSVDSFVPGSGLLPSNVSGKDGLGCFLYNALYANLAGEFENAVFDIEGVINSVLGFFGPATSTFLSLQCTPNYPEETSPDRYGGFETFLKATEKLPGAPKKQACLDAGAGHLECNSQTNVYGGSS